MAIRRILLAFLSVTLALQITPLRPANASYDKIINVNDYPGATDTDRIQSALNDVPPSGAIVVVPEGIWEVANLTGVSNVILTGRNVTVLRLIAQSPIITFKDSHDFVVQNFTIDGASVLGGSAIRVAGNSYNFTIQNNYFQDVNRTAINIELGEVGQEISDFSITNNTFNNCQDATVRIFGIVGRRDIKRFRVSGNRIIKGFVNGKIAAAFAAEGLIAYNEIFDTEHGIATRSVSSITIEYNIIRNTTGRGLYLSTNVGDVGPDNVTIRGNIVTQGSIGLSRWYGASSHKNILVCGNMIYNNTLLDILVDFPATFNNNTVTSREKLEVQDCGAKFIANKDIEGKLIMPTDINGDMRTDIKDVGLLAKAYGSVEGSPNWNPVADVIKDGKIDMKDLSFVAKNFGQTY